MNNLTVPAINLEDRLVFSSDGHVFPITNMYDSDAEETDILEDVVIIVAGPDANGKWWQILVNNYTWVRH